MGGCGCSISLRERLGANGFHLTGRSPVTEDSEQFRGEGMTMLYGVHWVERLGHFCNVFISSEGGACHGATL